MGAANLDVSLLDVSIAYIPTPSTTVTAPTAQGIVTGNSNVSSTAGPWFLQDETLALQHGDQTRICVTDIELQPSIRAIEEMLEFWIRNGHNNSPLVFLH
jgi:hypothetical protein